MKTKTKIMQLAIVGAFSSLFFTGCASDRAYYNDDISTRPIDLLDRRADTYRASRSGLDDFARSTALKEVPTGVVIEEAAGTERD